MYNLLVDPKEEALEKFYFDDTWVDYPLWEVIEEHAIPIEKDAGAPGPQSERDENRQVNIGGEGGIRTLDTLLTYTPLAGERLQPLGHFT